MLSQWFLLFTGVDSAYSVTDVDHLTSTMLTGACLENLVIREDNGFGFKACIFQSYIYI